MEAECGLDLVEYPSRNIPLECEVEGYSSTQRVGVGGAIPEERRIPPL